MKRILAVLLILIQCLFVFPMQAVAFDEQTTVIVHYKETKENDKDWNLWIWPVGGEGSAFDFTGEDNFGKVTTVTLSGKHDEVGFIVRTESWEKDTPNDRFITEFNKNVGEIWLLGGQEEVYYENPEGADFIAYETVDLTVNYHSYDSIYNDLFVIAYTNENEPVQVSLDKKNNFGTTAKLHLENTLDKEKVTVEIYRSEYGSAVKLQSFDIKKIKDGIADIYLVENNDRVYYTQDDAVYKPMVLEAKLNDSQTIALKVNMPFKATKDNIVVLVEGKEVEIKNLSFIFNSSDFNDPKGEIKLLEKVSYSDEITIKIPLFDDIKVQLGDVYDTEEFISAYTYFEDDLGPTYTENSTLFKVWAPTAADMKLSFFADHKSDATNRYDMLQGEKGVWSVEVEGDLHNQLYAYEVKHQTEYELAVDPYAKGVSVNGLRSAVIDLERTNPANWDMDYSSEFTSITDAIMYEIHVRDFSVHNQSGMINKGLFLAFTETETETDNGFSTGLDYIKELGVTHIQLMPVYDFGSIDESKNEYQFNWGYDPMNYNAIEGSYASDAFTPDVRINEFKQAINAIHDQELRVTMDVVYNHVFSLNAMAFEKLVPGYYFRKEESGSYANGSGCGNETASERPMVRKFMVDSVVYLADEYNLDGFRFDLMGLHDVETMNEIRNRLNDLDPTITIIGEGWNMGNVLNELSKANQNQAHLMPGIAHFNDTMRDGLKGSVFNALDQGFVNGKDEMESVVFSGIIGGVWYDDIKTWGDIEPNQSVSYVEAHDNNTLYDKLKLSNPDASVKEIERMHLLADSIVLTSQGVTFIHAGQEFLRTKLGDENSYKSSDIINRLDWTRREKKSDTVEYFKGLISLNQTHEAFRLRTKEAVIESIKPIMLENNIIAYSIKSTDDWAHIVVIHNSNNEEEAIALPEKGIWHVVVKNGKSGLDTLETVEGDSITVAGIDTVVMYLSDEMKVETTDNSIFVYIVIMIVGFGVVTGLYLMRKK